VTAFCFSFFLNLWLVLCYDGGNDKDMVVTGFLAWWLQNELYKLFLNSLFYALQPLRTVSF